MIRNSYNSVVNFIKKYDLLFLLLAMLVLGFFCFHHLDVKYVDSWDEARHGVNAYEMIKNGDYIRHTYNYEVDYWNLKPSISYWSIVLGFKLFGFSVMGLRAVAAAAYLLTALITALFVRRYSRIGGILVIGLFCANTLPLKAHLARAGDADSLYLLFFTAAMLCMLMIEKKKRWLVPCGLFFALAFLTKSWHAGIIAVIGGLFLLLSGEFFRMKSRYWTMFWIAVAVPIAAWFGARLTKDGFTFLIRMVQTDLLARTGSSNFEGHQAPFSYYWTSVLGNKDFIYPWILVIAIAVGALVVLLGRKGVFGEKKISGQLLIGIGLWFGVTFLGFSAMKTKLIWYCYPAIVPVFVLCAIAVGMLLEAGTGKKAETSEESPKDEMTETAEESPKDEKTETPEETRTETEPLTEPVAEAISEETVGVKEQHHPAHTFFGNVGACVQIVCALAMVILVAHFMLTTYDSCVRSVQGDGFQDYLKLSVTRESEYAGAKAYIMITGENPEYLGEWDQNRLFLGEIYGDYHCMDGGVDGFVKEKDACVLYIDRENYASNEKLLRPYDLIFTAEGYPYLVLRK